MIEQAPVLVRMRDVGFTLGAAGSNRRPLTRTHLQKSIYLLDIVSLLYDLLPPSVAHLTYMHGPYDATIQNAVDSLDFRGLVTTIGVQRTADDEVRSSYRLTKEGEAWIGELHMSPELAPRWEAACCVAQQVEAYGWDKLVDLVYSEPTFMSTRLRGYGQRLPLGDGVGNTAAHFLAIIEGALGPGPNSAPVSRDLVIKLFFRYLAEYDRISSELLDRGSHD